ncbi:FAD/NAD(P)-binding protein [Massilia sp. TS11]|uniref:FAD/NAD(P)-binding protein n=1 Tax=Massilia sp. TS11 TaxID=2908003 RepID=UPI001EDB1187|nr:FAD/NAD(P)-binding protein [Massilia sp. TS11]
MRRILVIGAGFSGAVVAARLLREAQGPLEVCLVNGSGPVARGMAYGTQSADHCLNVPAGNMSAYDEDPGHFLRYAQTRLPHTGPGDFVPRALYGDYLEHLLAEAERKASHARLERRLRQVERIEGGQRAYFNDGSVFVADQIVLALGHFPSTDPAIADPSFYRSARYLRDPWDTTQLSAIGANDPVLLLGTGLTAVDMSLSLLARNPARPILAVSRRGLIPQAHRSAAHSPAAGDAHSIWGEAQGVRAQLRGLRNFCRALEAAGRDWREAFAILRQCTAPLWEAYDLKQRRRFLRHVQPFWDTHRHRIAPQLAQRFQAALDAGVIQIHAGRLQRIDEVDGMVTAWVRPRGQDALLPLQARWVINCTGPSADPRQASGGLVQQLLAEGRLCADPLGLGINVAPDYALRDAQGNASDSLFYIGPWLKADFWEATAVPDLRRIARELAARLLRA